MSNLVDRIEQYIKAVFENSSNGFIIIQRSELASQFDCAPSQINYVLSTRFSVEQGYMVESRRGGGGYLRIVKLGLDTRDRLDDVIGQYLGSSLSQKAGEGLLKRLFEEGLLNRREVMLLGAMINRDTLSLPLPQRDELRARLLIAILRTMAREDF